MSTAASSTLPTVVRSQSTHGQVSYSSPASGQPTRTRSNAPRPTSSSHHSHRSSPRTYPHDTPPTANQAVLANVAQRDFEMTNVARPSSSRRSSSRDGQSDYRSEAPRSHQRTSSRPGSSRNSTDMSGVTAVANGGPTSAPQPAAYTERPPTLSQPSGGRRRTSVTTSTGTWLLGKTIGQGSMGKVKLAKNLETGEQVRYFHIWSSGQQRPCLADGHIRSQLRSYRDKRRTNMAIPRTNAQIDPKRFELPERQQWYRC
jgi:serine/threonine protein kinase KIN1/2